MSDLKALQRGPGWKSHLDNTGNNTYQARRTLHTDEVSESLIRAVADGQIHKHRWARYIPAITL